MIVRRQLLETLRTGRDRGLTVAELVRRLAGGEGDPSEVKRRVDELLAEAEERGEVVAAGKGRVVAVEYTEFYVGTVRLTARGFGVVRLDADAGIPEIVVPPEALTSAMDGDLVMVKRRTRRRKGQLVEERFGEVTRVLRRRRTTVVGRYMPDPNAPWVEPFARRLTMRVLLTGTIDPEPRPGEFVEVALESVPEGGGDASGRLLRRLGAAGEQGVAEDVTLADLGIPVEFPPAALREAAELPDAVAEEDGAGRVDRRDHPAVTIDGETARDFDDAVVAFPAAGGGVEVFVHIADVSHYVVPGTALDAAARERGTSVYLPGRAIAMLPEKLSNGLCSLVEGEDRLAFSVRFVVTPDGGVEGYRAERSVFRSRRRCTYTEVFGWLESGGWPAGLPAGVKGSLELLDEAAHRLGERRRIRGAIDFDLPEPEILLDPEGFMTGIRAVERNRAHRLIEELMITANECVARMLVWGRQPGLFRVHERPSAGRLAELQAVLEEFDLTLRGDLEELPPKELQRVLGEIVGRPEERFLQTLILRSLARAAYLPECKGHYALATDFYLHFTSPIRRYPDLVVHRFLGELLAKGSLRGPERDRAVAGLEDLAPHCSFTERRAEEAERRVAQWKQVEYMREHVGEEFSGHVGGVVAFGLFVQLDEVFVEGLVHVSDLRDDTYRYDEIGHRLLGARHGGAYRLGDAVRVRVKGVDEESLQVDLVPVGAPARGEDGRGRERRVGTAEKPRAPKQPGRPPRRRPGPPAGRRRSRRR